MAFVDFTTAKKYDNTPLRDYMNSYFASVDRLCALKTGLTPAVLFPTIYNIGDSFVSSNITLSVINDPTAFFKTNAGNSIGNSCAGCFTGASCSTTERVITNKSLVYIELAPFSELRSTQSRWTVLQMLPAETSAEHLVGYGNDVGNFANNWVYIKSFKIYDDSADGEYSADNPRTEISLADVYAPITVSEFKVHELGRILKSGTTGQYMMSMRNFFKPVKAMTIPYQPWSTTSTLKVSAPMTAVRRSDVPYAIAGRDADGTCYTTCIILPSAFTLLQYAKMWGVPVTTNDPSTKNKKELPDVDGGGQPENPTGGGDGTGDNDSDPITFPSGTPFTPSQLGGYALLSMTPTEFSALTTIMWKPEIKSIQDALHVYYNVQPLTECVQSILYYPFDVSAHDITHVVHSDTWKIGWSDDLFSADAISNQYDRKFDMGEYTINEYYGTFMDYAPYTSIDIWLPYIGYKSLDTDSVMNKTLRVVYYVDFADGLCTAVLFADGQPINTYTGQIAIPIPVTARDSAAKFRNVADAVMSAVTGVNKATSAIMTEAAGAIAGGSGAAAKSAAKSAANNISMVGGAIDIQGQLIGDAVGVAGSLMQQARTVTYGTVGSENWLYMPQRVHLKFTRTRTATPSGYTNIIGYPTTYTGTVGSFAGGFLKCKKVEGVCPSATADEMAEITNLLQAGVYV